MEHPRRLPRLVVSGRRPLAVSPGRLPPEGPGGWCQAVGVAIRLPSGVTPHAVGERGVDWVTYSRAPFVTPAVAPRTSWVEVDGKRLLYRLADEAVEIAGYGKARQLGLYEHDKVVFQILASDTTTNGARLIWALRARWCIENTLKYAEEHQGIHWLCSYAMGEVPDDTLVDNPARVAGRARHKTATAALKGVPAKLARDEIHPGAIRARPRLERRALQMVCRLPAHNAELDLARKLNAYLGDCEYRAVTANLLHLSGVIDFRPHAITVRLDRPDPPRLARALGFAIEQINLRSPRLRGDGRTITYVLESPVA